MMQHNPMNFGAPPPAPSAWGRLQPYLRTAATGGVLAILFLAIAQRGLPENWRPSDIAGDAAGSAERHEAQQKMAAKVEIERRVADGVAQAQAKAQTDVLAIQATVDERNKGLAGLSSGAAIADWACMAGQAIAANTQPTRGADWRQRETGWHENAQAIARATCGLGNALREQVTASQLDAVHTAAAARGMSMMDGAVPAAAIPASPVTTASSMQAAAAPAPVVPRSLDEVYAIAQASQSYSWDEVMKARAYIRTLPQPVQDRLFAGLDDHDGQGWNVLVERARAYVVVAAFK